MDIERSEFGSFQGVAYVKLSYGGKTTGFQSINITINFH